MGCASSSATAPEGSVVHHGASLSRASSDPSIDERLRIASMRALTFDKGNVMVAVRVRPTNKREKDMGSGTCLAVDSSTQMTLMADDIPAGGAGAGAAAPRPQKEFTFDSVFPMEATQEQVYALAARKILGKVIEGYNGCIFAYGQTGAGKTWTMEGSPKDPGVIPRLCEELFMQVTKHKRDRSIVVRASYLEIYQENLVDLLVPPEVAASRETPSIREDANGGVYVEHTSINVVNSYADVAALLEAGTARRAKAETRMNAVSSRSHAVLSLEVDQTDNDDAAGLTRMLSKLHLIDLAGSERQASTGATGARLKEGAKINQSLSALGNVINALTEKGRAHIPYRDSKLTRLLQDSLGGNSRTLMICNVSPASVNRDETLSSLRFAERAKKIQNKARVNVDPAAQRIAELMEENRRLQARIMLLEGRLVESGLQVPGGEGEGEGEGGGPPRRKKGGCAVM